MQTSEALDLWRGICVELVLDDIKDLTLRQMAILLSVYLEPPPHSVRGLASKLNVTKPVITRALDSMGQLGLISRRRDPHDKRNVIISRTIEGSLYLEKFADIISMQAKKIS